MNVMMVLEMAAQGFGDRVACVSGEDSLTYQELYDAAGQVAAYLRASDCDYLAMLDISSLALPIGLFGAAWAGKPFVPINYRLAEDQVAALLPRIQPALLLTDATHTASIPGGVAVTPIARDAFIDMARSAKETVKPDWHMDPEEVAVLLFTSGTTGAPKAAVLRHRHLVSYIFSSVEFGAAAEDDVALGTVPPYHIAGVVSVLSSAYAGRRVVQMPNFSPGGWLETARRERVTTAFVVPTMLAQIVNELQRTGSANLPRLASIAYGGGKMPAPVIESALSLFPETGFTQAYGMTETASTITVLYPDDHRAAFASDDPAVRRRLVSVGRALPGVELQVRDGQGNVLPAGQRGEVYVRGEQVAGEYVGKGSLLDAEGWFATRDAGEIDDEGYLFLEGRADDVIVRGAENMSPGEIEDVLVRHLAVADVCVVGVPDTHWGEAVAAVVVLKPDATVSVEELQGWVREHLRSSRVPQSITFTEALPYNETGKLLRRVIRADLATGH
ncbi:MAG: acyl--CoA ligase [Halioglobus sp.]|nr:acyl--CoA ligase [Halioglobus sp.]